MVRRLEQSPSDTTARLVAASGRQLLRTAVVVVVVVVRPDERVGRVVLEPLQLLQAKLAVVEVIRCRAAKLRRLVTASVFRHQRRGSSGHTPTRSFATNSDQAPCTDAPPTESNFISANI